MNKTTCPIEARQAYKDLAQELAETEVAHKAISEKLIDLCERTEAARVHSNNLANART